MRYTVKPQILTKASLEKSETSPVKTGGIRYAVLFFALLFAVPSWAKLKNYGLDELAPDQANAGFAEVAKKAEDWLDEAKGVAKVRGTSVKEEVVNVLNRELQRGVESVESPDGLIRITDGHHKVLATRKLLSDMHISQSKVEFSADVLKDFKGDDWEKYVKWREAHNPTYFPESFDHEHASFEKIVAYYKALPTSFDKIEDLPMRSATGRFFDELGVKGSNFDPFIQFRFGEELKDLGIKVKPGQEFSFETQRQIRDAVFKGKSSAKLIKLLKDSAIDGKSSEVKAAIAKIQSLVDDQTASDIADHSVESLYGRVAEGTDLSKLDVPLPDTKKQFSALLKAAQERYAERVDQNDLKDVLKALSNGDELSGKQVKFLKDARKSALNLRSAIKLLGDDGAKDDLKQFRNFVTELGNLDDRLGDWDLKGKTPGAIRKSADDVLGLLDKTATKVTITAKTPEQFAAMQQEQLTWLRDQLSKKKISISDYHDIRKMVRDYKGLFELMQEDDPKPATNAALAKLNDLSKSMGKLKDGLEIPVDEKEAANFIKHPTTIDPDTKKDLQTFLSMVDNQGRVGPHAGASCSTLFRKL
jgi:CHAD domain-containing protein